MDPWDDPDMNPDNERMNIGDMAPEDQARFIAFMNAFNAAREKDTPAAWIKAGDLGLSAYRDRLSMPIGLEKLVVLQVSWCGVNLWDDHHIGPESDPYMVFAMEEIVARGWGPDGNKSPLGVQHQYVLACLAENGYIFERSGDKYGPRPQRGGLFGRR